VGQQGSPNETQRFGRFLRKVRENRKLSLDAVEEMSIDFPDRLTKSHLSRIENGQAEPSVRKLFALSQIYGMPLTALAEEFEIDLRRELAPADLSGRTEAEIMAEARSMMLAGRYADALILLTAALDGVPESPSEGRAFAQADRIRDLRLGILNCLSHMGRYEKAKLEAEEILGDPGLSDEQKIRALQVFVDCCYRLSRFTVALMGLERAEAELKTSSVPPRHEADFAVHRGNLMVATGRHEEAVESYAKALQIYEQESDPFEACRTRVNMANALVETHDLSHARQQAEAALLVAEASGYDRLASLAMSHLAVVAYHRGEMSAAQSWAIRSNAIARSREYVVLVFRNCYYLLLIARAKGDHAAEKVNESTLRACISRIEDSLPEVEAFRAEMAGGES
jgi:transcriptional regulator with XRE-family HTH domain